MKNNLNGVAELVSVDSIQCERLTPLNNELTETIQRIARGDVLDLEPNPFANKKCPHCGASYYSEGNTFTTAVYYPPIYKDGVNINPDRNSSTTTYHCFECDRDWTETT